MHLNFIRRRHKKENDSMQIQCIFFPFQTHDWYFSIINFTLVLSAWKYPSLMNLDLRNVFSNPRQVLAHRRECSVILAVFHHETGNAMNGPRIIAVSAHQRPARICTTSVRIGNRSESDTNNFHVVFAFCRVYDRHTGLHQGVGGSFTRVACPSPTWKH